MNVLGVICDSKLSWDKHISYVITKAEKALNALRLISKLFSSKQLLQLLFAEVWCHYYQGPARQGDIKMTPFRQKNGKEQVFLLKQV